MITNISPREAELIRQIDEQGGQLAAWRDRAIAAEARVAALEAAIQTAYGYLWCVNNEPGTPNQYSPERAAHEARKHLRGMLTTEQRGHGINDVLPIVRAAPPAQPADLIEMSPEFTDTARSALLWVLWHHQGGSSKVGQPIRFALGMGQHEHLSDDQIREAKRWDLLPQTVAAQPAEQQAQTVCKRTLVEIDARLRECSIVGASAADAYDTFYQHMVETALAAQPAEPVQRLSDEQIDAILHEAGVDEFAAIPIEYDRQVARAIESALQPGWRPEWPAFVEYWTHESHLQTFADRERFRAAAKAMLEAAPKATK